LRGCRVVVTRPERQATGLVERLTSLGAQVSPVPLIRTEPVGLDPQIDAALERLAEYTMVIVTSANAADCFADALRRHGAAVPPGVTTVAIGRATAARLHERGIATDVIPPQATGAAIAAALADSTVAGARILLPRARSGRPELPRDLRCAGAVVDDVAFYDTVAVVPGEDGRAALRAADAVIVTSPSAVEALIAAVGVDASRSASVVTIGPTTSDAARRRGLKVLAEAADQSVDGLADAVVTALGKKGDQPPS
jgi:uroporphyrinogen III methyltransferase/synthase